MTTRAPTAKALAFNLAGFLCCYALYSATGDTAWATGAVICFVLLLICAALTGAGMGHRRP